MATGLRSRIDRYAILAKSQKKTLYLSGGRFRDYGFATTFATRAAAARHARYLEERYPVLDSYRLKVVGISTGIARASNPLPLLAALHATSGVRTLASSKKKKNPAPRKNREIEEAGRRLEDFTGHAPTELIRHKMPDFKVGLVIGTLDAVPYTTVRDGKTEHYLHEFSKRARPLLVASSDGRQLGIVGGRFQFTEAGIVDDV